MSFGVTTSNIFEALSGGDRALNRKVVKKTEQAAKPQQQQKQEKPVEHKAPVGAVLAKQSNKANAPTQDKVQRPQSAPTTTTTVKSEQKQQTSEQQKGGFQTQERKQRPRPQTAQGEQQDKPRGPRAPRQEGDRKPRQEGERKPRQEGERKPRQEGDKEFRPRRQEGDRPARRPRQEGENGENAPRQEGERKQYGQRVGPRRGREFERHSGTGRGREVAKDGEGAHSWGKAGGKGDILAATEDVLSPVTDKVEETETPAEPKEKTPEELEEEENAKLVTYDEFLKKKKTKDTTLANLKKPAPRVAGEGEEQQDLKGVVVKKAPKQKKVKTEAEKAASEKKVSAESKKTVSIQEFLKDVEVPTKRRENRDRENRGGDRNREGGDRKPFNKDNRKGGDRNNNRDNRRPASGNQSPVPNVNDEASFPSLGKQ